VEGQQRRGCDSSLYARHRRRPHVTDSRLLLESLGGVRFGRQLYGGARGRDALGRHQSQLVERLFAQRHCIAGEWRVVARRRRWRRAVLLRRNGFLRIGRAAAWWARVVWRVSEASQAGRCCVRASACVHRCRTARRRRRSSSRSARVTASHYCARARCSPIWLRSRALAARRAPPHARQRRSSCFVLSLLLSSISVSRRAQHLSASLLSLFADGVRCLPF
jgi:hypothetical protein